MNFGKILLSVSAAVAISSAAAVAGLAPIHVNPQGETHDPGGTVKTSTAAFQWADDANSLPTDFAAHQVGSTLHLHCGASAGCVVFVQSTMEIASVASGDEWFICAEVDGHNTDPTECFEGLTPSINTVQGVYNGNLQVGKGSHAIKFILETQNAATLFTWHEAAQMLQ